MIDPNNHFGARVKAAREARGVNQVELAAACGYSQGGISRIESGNVDPPLSLAMGIARALDTTLGALADDA